jgi:hypothetical protein
MKKLVILAIFLGVILNCSAPQTLEPTELDYSKVIQINGKSIDIYSKVNQYFAEKHLFAKYEITLTDEKNRRIVARSLSMIDQYSQLRFSYTIEARDNRLKADLKVQDVFSMNPYYIGPRKPFKSESGKVKELFDAITDDLEKYLNNNKKEDW